jgi:FemAB-related protein (PEP-CTERM system-associated)
MIVEQLAPRSAGEWDAYVGAHPHGNVYHLRVWQAVAERAYRLYAPHLIARERPGGPVRGVLPLFVVGSALHRYVTSGLFGAYGPLLADDEQVGRALLREARAVADRQRARYLILKWLGDASIPQGFARRDLCVIATLPLERDPDVMWRRLRPEIRRAVKKAQRTGLALHSGPGELAGYYDVLAENMHRKGTPIYGLPFMRELVETLGDAAELITLRSGDEVVSAALVVYCNRVVYVPFVSSRPSAFHLRPNNLLYWEIIRRSCLRGMEVLDFGRSPQGSGGLEFKRRWGAQVEPQPFYLYAARGELPRMDLDAPTVQWLIHLWRRLPRPIADALGPSVCRRFLA